MRGSEPWRVGAVVGLALWLAALPAACGRPGPEAGSRPTAQATPTPHLAPTPTERPRSATVGQEAPDFGFPTMQGGMARLSDYRGKVVLVNLWATWCWPCRLEVPDLVAAYERYKDRGFVVLAVNQGEQQAQVEAFASHFGMHFPVLLDEEEHIRYSYPYRGIPTSFLIDRKGIVRSVWVGMLLTEVIEQLVEPLLGT